MRQPTLLIEDGTGQTKLKTSLPGGRYQLSLRDRAITLFTNDLGLSLGSRVPDPFVPFAVAARDAWFPREKDIDRILAGLPSGGNLTSDERTALINYATSTLIHERDVKRFLNVVEKSPISGAIGQDDLRVKKLPEPPSGFFEGADSESKPRLDAPPSSAHTKSQDNQSETPSETPTPEDSIDSAEKPVNFEVIPGIGPLRAELIGDAGFTSLEQLAETSPADLAETEGISEEIAMVAVEGAREETHGKRSTAERLEEATDTDASTFEAALSSLAASGVPPSEASPVLGVLYGPTVAEVDGVSGQQAYFLWREGYRIPADVANATAAELEQVPQIGSKTAPEIKKAATRLVDKFQT